MSELWYVLISSLPSMVIGSWAGWFFGRKRQNIDTIDAAVETWQKIVNALEDRLNKEIDGKICAEQKIDKLTEQVHLLEEKIEELEEVLKRSKNQEIKIRKYEKLLADNNIAF